MASTLEASWNSTFLKKATAWRDDTPRVIQRHVHTQAHAHGEARTRVVSASYAVDMRLLRHLCLFITSVGS